MATPVEKLLDHRIILVVDDDPDVRTYIQQMLSRLSDTLVVQEASNGREALTLLEESVPDVVVSDLNMPILDGFELLTAIRGSPRLRDLFVMVLTGMGHDEAEVDVLEAGANDFLTKPINRTEFLARIRGMLRFKLRQDSLRTELATVKRTLISLMAKVRAKLPPDQATSILEELSVRD